MILEQLTGRSAFPDFLTLRLACLGRHYRFWQTVKYCIQERPRSLLLFYLVVHNFFPLLYPFSWVVHTLNFVLQLFYYSVPNFPFDSFLSFISLLRFSSFSCFKCVHATAKLLQPCMTLCVPIDGSPRGSSVPGILQARTLEWVAISFSNA